jgi:recombination protein RecA
MTPLPPNVEASLATLRERWGSAAPRWGTEVIGALAVAPSVLPEDHPDEAAAPRPLGRPVGRPLADERAVSSGFGALDAILGLGGLPRAAATALHGTGSSGKTTLALTAAAQAQAAGGLVAYLDLARSLDPVEAVARGVRLEWLVVLTPDSLTQAMAMAAMLLQDRTVDLLLLDLPSKPLDGSGLSAAVVAERFGRLAALARRAGVQLLVLEPQDLPSALAGALSQVAALRLELSRRAWIRLGRDVVGQRTRVLVERDRFGPAGRAAELRILYAEGGTRDACLAAAGLLSDEETRTGRVEPGVQARSKRAAGSLNGMAPPGSTGAEPPRGDVRPRAFPSPIEHLRFPADATSSSPLAPSAPPSRPQPILRTVGNGAAHPGRDALDGRLRARRERLGARDGGSAGHAAGSRAPARAGGALSRSGS